MMSIQKNKPLDIVSMTRAYNKLSEMELNDDMKAIANSDMTEIRNHLFGSFLSSRNYISLEDAKTYTGLSIIQDSDDISNETVLKYELINFMAMIDRYRNDDDMKIISQSSGKTEKALTTLFGQGHGIAWIEEIRSDYGIGYIAPKGMSGDGNPVPDYDPKEKVEVKGKSQQQKQQTDARMKAEIRKKDTPASDRNAPPTMPKIQKATEPTATVKTATAEDPAQAESPVSDIHVFEPLTLDDVLETPPLDFITDNLVVRNTVNVFFAPAKTGKTYLCLYYAVCMTKGIPFLGMETHLKRNVGYLNLDMFRGGFNDRMKQVIRGFNPNSTPDDIRDILNRLRIIDRESIRSAKGNTPNFFDKKYLDDLRFFIEVNNIEFLFVDTFSRIRAGSKENDNDHMGLVLQNAEEFFSPLECTSLFIHHTGKDQTTIRGAQALIDNSEFVFGLRKVNNSNKHLQLFSDTPRYTDVFELDVYPVFQQSTNDETGARIAESYFLTTADPDNENSDITDFLKSHGNVWMSKTNLALAVDGNYDNRRKEVDALYAQGKLERVKSGRGFNYRIKESL